MSGTFSTHSSGEISADSILHEVASPCLLFRSSHRSGIAATSMLPPP
jgi:hypothetical protein